MRFTTLVLLAMTFHGWAVAGTANIPKDSRAALPDYQRARYSELHFRPAIDKATDEQCLACHAEVLKPSVRGKSPAGVNAVDTKAWYQRQVTYEGSQETFHRRHLVTPLAKQLMDMRCITCHQGNEPRDEAPGTSASSLIGGYTLRKHVDTEATCLKCHGQMNWQVMGLPEPWHKSKALFQDNCLLCHENIRTRRHQVSYLNAAAIEQAAKTSADTCYGCHGGRAWYRINYPYPRHAWPGMPEGAPPDWAKGRMTESEARFIIDATDRAGK